MRQNRKEVKIIPPKVSVILLAGNDEDIVKKSIDSILNQTLSDIEIIIVNNKSSDFTFSYCADYMAQDSRISLYSKTDTSLGTLAKLANGEYIIFLDTSKILAEDALETLYYKAKTTEADFVFSNYSIGPKEVNIQNNKLLPNSPFSWGTCPNIILNISPYFLWNKLYDKSFLNNVLKKIKEYNICDELDFVSVTFASASCIAYLQRSLVQSFKEIEPTIEAEEWKESIASIVGFELLLSKENTFLPVKQSFLNYVLDKFMHLINIPEPYCGIVSYYLTNDACNYFNFLDYPSSYYYDTSVSENYKRLKARANLSPELEEFHQNKAENIIPIVITTETPYSKSKSLVTIQSIKEHLSRDYLYDLYVLAENDSWREQFESLSEIPLRDDD